MKLYNTKTKLVEVLDTILIDDVFYNEKCLNNEEIYKKIVEKGYKKIEYKNENITYKKFYTNISEVVEEDEIVIVSTTSVPQEISQIKEQLKSSLSSKFETYLNKSDVFVESIGYVDAGQKYLENINALLAVTPDDATIPFILADNSSITLPKSELKRVQLVLQEYIVNLYAKKHELRTKIEQTNEFDELVKLDEEIELFLGQ